MNDFFDIDGIFHFGSDTSKRRDFGDNSEDYQSSQFHQDNFNFENQSQNFSFGIKNDSLFSLMEDFMSTFSHDFGMFPAFPGMSQGGPFGQKRPPNQSLRDQLLKKPEEGPSTVHDEVQERNRQNQNIFGNDNIDSLFESFFGRSFVQPFVGQDLPKEDTDLDSDVQQQGLDSTLKIDDSSHDSHSRRFPFHHHSSFSSKSRSMIRRADGSTEQRITRRSSDGAEEITIISETPSGERRTEIRRGDGSVDVVEDEINRNRIDDRIDPNSPSVPFYTDTMFPRLNSFFNYFFGK